MIERKTCPELDSGDVKARRDFLGWNLRIGYLRGIRYVSAAIVLIFASCSPAEITTYTSRFAQEQQFQLASPAIQSEAIFFTDKNSIELDLGLAEAEIRYTLDGSEPVETAPLFTESIVLEKSTTLKTKAFHPQYLASKSVSAQFFKLNPQLPIESVTLNREPHANYLGTGADGLVDRRKGTTNFRTDHWMGFAGGNVALSVNLAEPAPIKHLIISLLSDPNSWIFLPAAVEVYGGKSKNAINLLAQQAIEPTMENSPIAFHFANVSFAETSVKFLKVVIKSQSEIPAWHMGKGTPPWLFVDEVVIQ
ncbi:MAG: FN3 associated domain-containing protein [Saprospiraceae bacterium]